MTLNLFHPLVERWFTDRFAAPTSAQAAGWPAISRGEDTLITAPTGSGKTLAAFLWAINRLVKLGLEGKLKGRTYVVYVSPLKALSNDIHKNLLEPLAGIQKLAVAEGMPLPEIRVAVRTGDTPAWERQQMIKHPPHILITTPESLYILLTAEKSRGYLATAETVIVDEIHAVAGDKRGAHLAISLERLERLSQRIQRIGLSATIKPIQDIASLLVGSGRLQPNGVPICTIIDHGHRRDIKLSVEVPNQELGPIATHEMWAEVYDRIAAHIQNHRTTLIFVNTRRLAERVSHQLTTRLGEGKVAAHHGSLSRRTRFKAEEGLKSGEVPAVVATASLELGIDIGHVDLVCHIGAPRALATLLQRVGRSGHQPVGDGQEGAVPQGILFPMTRDELVQCAAAVRAVRAGMLDGVTIPRAPLDILAQQMVAITASEETGEEELYNLIRRAFPYRDLQQEDFDAVLEMLSEGVATRLGRRSAHIHRDRVNGWLRGRRGARLAAITSGGAIPDTADYDVIEEPAGTFVGKVNEDFAVESIAGDIFLLGNKSWRIRRVESGKVRVEDAQGAPPTIPFWLGEAPARSLELSSAVAELRQEVAVRLGDIPAAVSWLQEETGVDQAGAEQIVAYIAETVATLGEVPSQEVVITERFFDEAGGMQLVVHAPFGARINRAWGLALRKRFCVTFDFELQAAATDDGFILSLGEQHSFPLESVFAMVRTPTLEKDLIQALLATPLFTNRWRWNISRSLTLLRYQGGRKVPLPIQRMRADDLLAAVFPQQAMCVDNRSGPVEVPDHPLVNETIDNCLHEAMDLEGARALITAVESGRLRTLAVDTPAPSPMSHEILNSNPYTFLDDAPLEERRAQAVSLRRTDPDLAKGIGALDPEAIAQVQAQSWPDVRDADEAHDALLTLGLLPVAEANPWGEYLDQLLATGRTTQAKWTKDGVVSAAYVAAERLDLARTAIPGVEFDPEILIPPSSHHLAETSSEDDALAQIVQGWMEFIGPTSASALAARLGLSTLRVNTALALLESKGVVLRGRFTPGKKEEEIEWCDRRLLSRIHRLTLGRLRREIEPVTAADLLRFLFRWQHVYPGTQLHGRDGLLKIIGQLQGLELPAPAWESRVLPARIGEYKAEDLEALCLAGTVVWGRLRPSNGYTTEENGENDAPRRPPAPTRSAPLSFVLREDLPNFISNSPSDEAINGLSTAAKEALAFLEEKGASFLTDITQGTRRLPSQIEEALWELVARGLVTGDGIAGLRSLLLPEKKKNRARHLRRRASHYRQRLMPLGRWALLRTPKSPGDEESAEAIARQLLARYGVVFRELLAREYSAPAWRVLLRIYRTLEARGEIRGGRFVAGFIGEQFALPEAVESLRAIRRKKDARETVTVSAADPLNLVGIITPGARVSPLSNQVITYENGVPVQVEELGAWRHRLHAQAALAIGSEQMARGV